MDREWHATIVVCRSQKTTESKTVFRLCFLMNSRQFRLGFANSVQPCFYSLRFPLCIRMFLGVLFRDDGAVEGIQMLLNDY